MRGYLKKILCIVVLLAAAQTSYAGFFGWSTTVKATDGTSTFHRGATAPTYFACELERQNVVNDFLGLGYAILSNPACTPFEFQERFKIPALEPELIKWPWPGPGPWCLSCPYLVDGVIELIYPDQAKEVHKLVEKYDIGSYNQELRQLQERYDLPKFEQEMFQLEMKEHMRSR